MAKPWPERPVSAANKSGKQQMTRRQVPSIRASSKVTGLWDRSTWGVIDDGER